jgi:tRNA A37 threonylcarbamoyladenosine dehydratase
MDSFSKYISQIKFFGIENVKKMQDISVTIVGVGGLGSWLSEFLVRVGVKKLVIVDFDIVEEKNLNRQNYTLEDIGKLKIDALEKRLRNIDNNVEIKKYKEIKKEVFNTDIFFDCVDDIKTKYLLNEFSIYLSKPYIFGSVVMDQGFVGLINPEEFCFYDIFQGKEDVLTCNTNGLDPSAVFFASSLMLRLFLKYVGGDKKGKVYHFNIKDRFNLEELKVKSKDCKICKRKEYEIIWSYMR